MSAGDELFTGYFKGADRDAKTRVAFKHGLDRRGLSQGTLQCDVQRIPAKLSRSSKILPNLQGEEEGGGHECICMYVHMTPL